MLLNFGHDGKKKTFAEEHKKHEASNLFSETKKNATRLLKAIVRCVLKKGDLMREKVQGAASDVTTVSPGG